MLLEAGADANKAVINSGLTPLHIAAHYGHEAVVKVLLESGVDANMASDKGVTPLQMATQGGQPAVVKVLLEAGADANKASNTGCTPL